MLSDSHSYIEDLEGGQSGIYGGGQSRDIFRGGPVKKNHPVFMAVMMVMTKTMVSFKNDQNQPKI